ncbi:transmembrane protease serine 9-like [Tribolium madens]|uniref:transmembrane protease serine 9-like n=1 Tax=Tribolium madens TaxID=41895 RepID=UPI001CF74B8E|nr:transmembrane protease serine 9-like [Tribolium madens]
MDRILVITFALIASVLGAPHHNARIFGGDNATLGQFPFIVALNNVDQFCDGSIINKNWVVTAAHCIFYVSNNSTTVLAGTNKLHSGGISYNVSQALYHPEFNFTSFQNDIGLIHIVGEFAFTDNIQPVEFIEPEINATCQAVGWGQSDTLTFPETLQFVELTALGLDDCKRIAGDYAEGLYLEKEQICGLGHDGQGACYGDSGGPLVCDGKLAGIVSYGLLPCAHSIPDVYTRPSQYADWIKTVIILRIQSKMDRILVITFALIASVLGAPHHNVKIYGGDNATLGQFPFIVALKNVDQFCDGSIINKNWVVTAAHCIFDVSNNSTTVLAGTNKLHSGGISYNVSQALYHPEFNHTNIQNDIGLIQIVGEFAFSDNIQPVEFIEPEINATCQAVGWGETKTVAFPETLQFVELTALELDDCKRIAGDYAKGLYLEKEQICGLGHDGQGACYGDSGGPLVCDGKLAGIVSYALLPCAHSIPDVYTRPSQYADWIKTVEITKAVAIPTLLVDSASAIRLSKNYEFHKRSKHIVIRFHFVREKVLEETLNVEHIAGVDQIADIMTKPLFRPRFVYLRSDNVIKIEVLLLSNQDNSDEILILKIQSKMDRILVITFALIASVLGAPHHNVRIYGGDNATLGQFPFIVALNDNLNQFCDGSIVNKNWVVTAAHCIFDVSNNSTTVLAGTNKLHSGGISYNVSQALYHPEFNHTNIQNDIGLIQIVGEFAFSDNIQPVEFIEPEINATCQAVGWGETETGAFPETLQFVELIALGLDDCKRIAGDYAEGLYLGKEQICGLGHEGQGACFGDSGGPLICDGKLAGIVSYGLLPCARSIPDVYTRASQYADWINTVIQS